MNPKHYLRLCSHFFVAVIFTFVLASLFHSQFVIAELTLVGVEIGINDRLSMSLDDLLGLLPTYGVIITLSLLIAFPITAWLLRRFSLNPTALYSFAGAMAIATVLLAMHPFLETTLIAGARSTFGFVCQCLAGAFGGAVFCHLRTTEQQQ